MGNLNRRGGFISVTATIEAKRRRRRPWPAKEITIDMDESDASTATKRETYPMQGVASGGKHDACAGHSGARSVHSTTLDTRRSVGTAAD